MTSETPPGPQRVENQEAAPLGRDYLLLLQGQLVSHLGSQAFLIGVMFWTLEATQSAKTMGFFLAATTLPGVVLGPVAGALVDRWQHKPVLVTADAVRGLAGGGLAILVWLQPEATPAILACLFAVALVYGLSGALFQPAVAAAIPELVAAARVQQANSWIHASSQVAVLVGQAAGGVLYRRVGAAGLFAIDSASYLLSALSECWIRFPGPAEAEDAQTDDAERTAPRRNPDRRSFLADARDGLSLFWNDRGLRLFLLATAGINFLFMPVFVLLPFYVTEVLGRSSQWYGLLLAALSGGSLLGALSAAGLRLRGDRRGPLLVAILLAIPVASVVLAHVPAAGALAVLLTLGVLTGFLNVIVLSLVQLAAPPAFRGRVLGILISLSGAATPLGMVAGGLVGDWLTVEQVYTGVAIVGVVYVAAMITSPRLRQFLQREFDDGS